MHSQIKLGRIAGIEIGLHYSWFIIAALIVLSLTSHFHAVNPGWTPGMVWATALITAVLFFVSLLLHELAHSLVARARGLSVREITLFALGGVSQIESEAADARSEFWIAIVGPATSVVLGAVLMLLGRALGWHPGMPALTPVTAVLVWLGYINIALAAFNMIPGFPLDGGRVLRAIIWWVTGKAERSTRLASQVGQVVAFVFMFYGLFRFFVGGNFGGLWLAFIGWFLLEAARGSSMQVKIMAGLRDRRVADLMERDCGTVAGYLSLRDFVDTHLLHSSGRCFIVSQDNQMIGLITPSDLKRVHREEWPRTSVQSAMRPLSRLQAVGPEMPAFKAIELMRREGLSELLVVSDGHLDGVFSHGQLVRFLQVYSEAGKEPKAA